MSRKHVTKHHISSAQIRATLTLRTPGVPMPAFGPSAKLAAEIAKVPVTRVPFLRRIEAQAAAQADIDARLTLARLAKRASVAADRGES